MSELLPSPLHPDAEALSAFAENALPAHERAQTLAHLAGCPACREIVFLAQDAAQAPSPVAASTPQNAWSRWLNSLPVFGLGIGVAALAGAVLIFVTLHTRPTAAPAVALHTPPPLPPPAQTPAPAARPSPHPAVRGPRPLPLPKLVPPPKMPLLLRAEPPRPGLPAIAGGMAYGMGRGVAEAPAAGTGTPARPMGFLASHGDAVPQANAPQSITGSNNAQFSQIQIAPAKPAPVVLGAMAAPPPPPAAPPATAALDSLTADGAPMSASESVTVDSSASALSTGTANLSTTLPLDARAKQRSLRTTALAALPSKLPAAAVVSSGARTLATDTAGTLFLSLDAGQHWTAVTPPWPGKVSQLRTVPAASAAPSVPQPAQFQITTSSGTVWSSADGLHWQAAP